MAYSGGAFMGPPSECGNGSTSLHSQDRDPFIDREQECIREQEHLDRQRGEADLQW